MAPGPFVPVYMRLTERRRLTNIASMTTATTSRGPFLLQPRLDSKIWGGRRLVNYGLDLPANEPVGEAVITPPDAVIRNGPHAGKRLGEVIATDPEGLLGTNGLRLSGGRTSLPLLVKLIDATTDLSVQVHPDDARAPEGSMGKTEAWFVLEAEPGANLYVGLNDPAEFGDLAREARAGVSVGGRMRTVPARPGEVIFIPAGTVHAIGAGVLLYEIQQPSTITYRLDDWGRLDDRGQPRELHVEEALAVSEPELRPESEVAPTRTATMPAHPCVHCEAFALEVIALKPGDELTLTSEPGPTVFTCIEGAAQLSADGESVDLAKGETAVMLADAPLVRLQAKGVTRILRGWID